LTGVGLALLVAVDLGEGREVFESDIVVAWDDRVGMDELAGAALVPLKPYISSREATRLILATVTDGV
jgi:hypothetical protein